MYTSNMSVVSKEIESFRLRPKTYIETYLPRASISNPKYKSVRSRKIDKELRHGDVLDRFGQIDVKIVVPPQGPFGR